MHGDGPRDLALLTVQVAEDHLNFEGVGIGAGGGGKLLDRLIDLMLGEEIQPEHIVRGLAQPAAIDPSSVAQLVTLPRLAHKKADQQGHEGG